MAHHQYVHQSVHLPTVAKQQVHRLPLTHVYTLVLLDQHAESLGIQEVLACPAKNLSVDYIPDDIVSVVVSSDPLLTYDLRLCSLLTLSLKPEDENRWFRLL